ncbi:acyl carrier protein [Streptomyces sp. NPDC054796]|uniref:Acyl carrier protein n=1 Tax=Streptomyces daliensis TaxID=299421 RepID=A0A8T4INZ0_9ACTN|nr:acyl carrier protein [Streptomyces daliensis]
MHVPPKEKLIEELREFYASELEYPVDVVTADSEFEAELGVDSLHQITLLGWALERYGFSDVIDGLRAPEYATVTAVADLVLSLAEDR